MTQGLEPPASRRDPAPAVWLVLSLIAILAISPPETRGESMLGCAILAGLLLVLEFRRLRLAAGVGLAMASASIFGLAAARAGLVPSAATEAIARVLVAAGLGIAAWGLEVRDGRIAKVAAACGTVVAGHAVYQWTFGLERMAALVAGRPDLPDREALLLKLEGGRAFAAFSTPAALGCLLAMALPMTLAQLGSSRGRRQVVWAMAATLQALGLVAASSATAIAALGGATVLAGLAWTRARKRLGVALALAVLSLGLVGWLRGPALLDPGNADSPLRLRAGNFLAAWSMAADHPFAGVGPGGFSEAYPAYRRVGDNETRHVHDLPLELAAELGWPAGILLSVLFGFLFIRPLWAEAGSAEPWRRAVAFALAVFALHNLADFTFYMPSLLWLAALLRGWIARPREPAANAGGSVEAGVVLRAAVLASLLVALSLMALAGAGGEFHIGARNAAHAGETEAARRMARRAVALAPWDVDAALLLARLIAAESPEAPADSKEALAQVERVVELSPLRSSARELRARLRLRAGDLPGAYADMVQAARLHPAHPDYAGWRDVLGEHLRAGRETGTASHGRSR